MELVIKTNKLPQETIAKLLHDTSADFNNQLNDEMILTLSDKWFRNAENLYSVDSSGVIRSFMVYYSNQLPFIYTAHIWVDASCRGRGICSKMFSIAEQNAIAKGFSAHRLEVNKNNNVAWVAYNKLGFKMAIERESSFILEKVLKSCK